MKDKIDLLTKEELAYIAGFFDADGCITVSKKKSINGKHPNDYTLVFIIVNTNKEVLEYFKKIIGAGTAYTLVKYNPNRPNWKPCYRYQLVGEKCRRLCENIIPYTKVKKERLIKGLELNVDGHKTKGRGRTQEQYATQVRVAGEMKRMNRRGIVHESI